MIARFTLRLYIDDLRMRVVLLAQNERLFIGDILGDLRIWVVYVTKDARVGRTVRTACRDATVLRILNAERALLYNALRALRSVNQLAVLAHIGRITICIGSIIAGNALGLLPIELTHIVRTGRHTVPTSYAALIVYENDTILIGIGGSRRTHCLTRRIIALLAAHRRKLHPRTAIHLNRCSVVRRA